jgi:hypothetical protein
MDNFLMNNWDSYNSSKSLHDIPSYNGRGYAYTHDPYLFLERELEFKNKAQWQDAKNRGLIRHVKPYNGKWLDYVVHKEFSTLAEWVADCGATLSDVLYGVNRVHRVDWHTRRPQEAKFVCIGHYLEALGYEESQAKNDDTFTRIVESLGATKAVPAKGQRCLVKRPDGTIVIARVMDKRFEALDSDDGEPDIVISIPAKDGTFKDYNRLSDVPPDTEIYFKTTDDEFCLLNTLL